MPPRYVSTELADTVDGLSAETRYSKLVESFAPPPEPVQEPEPPRLDFTGALAPLRESAQAAIDSVQQTAGGFGQQISGALDDFRQAAIGGMGSGGYAPEALDMSSPDAYKRTLMSNAQAIASKYDLPANIIAAIPIQEAGYGGSELTRRANNLFSIKGEGPAGAEHFGSVWEVINGQNVHVPASFRKYNSASESFEDFAKLITETPRYANAVKAWKETRDPNAFIQEVQRAGYATDPTWAGKVASIASEMPSGGPMAQADNRNGTAGGSAFDPQSVAEQWKGLPYVFGGQGGRGRGITATDCSGFVAQVFKDQGLDLPAHTDAAYNTLKQRGQAVDPKDAQPGDVVFYMGPGTGGATTHHMGLYAGPGKVLDMSVASGGGVKERPIGHAGEYVIMRDPRLNPPVAPQQAEVAPPIQPTGVAEKLGGQKVKGVDIAQAMAMDGTMAYAAGGPPVRDDWSRSDSIADAQSASQLQVPGDDGASGTSATGISNNPIAPGSDDGIAISRAGQFSAVPPPRDIRGDYAPRAVEPGDFALPGQPVAPAETPPQASATPPQPGGAVEPSVASTEAPASSGNPIVDLFSDFGRKLSGILMPEKPDYSQPAQDIQQRQATLPGSPQAEALAQEPMPLQPVRDIVEASQRDYETYTRLNGRLLQGETLTPEEEQEMARAAINVVGDVSGIQNIGNKVVPGVLGRADEAVRTTAPSASIVSRAQAEEAIPQARPVTTQADGVIPQALDTAGTPGGFAPSGARDTAGQPGGMGAAGVRAAGSGAGAAYQESQQEGSTPESVLRAGASGVATSVGRSALGGRLGTRAVGTLSRAVQQAPQNQPPKTPAEAWDAVTETIKADAASPLSERLTDFARKLPASTTKNWFDATKPLRDATQDAEKALGRKLRPDENAWLQARLLPGTGRAVEEQVTQTLGPAVKGLDDVGLERLNGYAAALDAVDKAKATGNMARKFGQFNGVEAEQAIDHLRSTLSPFEMADLDKRMAQVNAHTSQLRDRMVESGLISQETADLFKKKYPNYSPIQFLDWLDDAERRVGQTTSLSVADNGVKRLTEQGASYQRKAPLEALLDATFATERRAARNEAAQTFADYTKIDPAFKDLMRPANEAAASYLSTPGVARKTPIGKKAPNETTFSMWENGVKHDFYMDKSLADAIRQDRWTMGGPAGTAIQAASAAFRAGATGSNILFLIPNATGDALTALVRGESPGSLLRGYKEAFTHGPEYQEFLKAGGGYSGMIESGTSAQSISRLRGPITAVDQLKAYASWVNPLKLAQELGERVEMAPRVGMFGQAIREGATVPEAALAGRDITMDFARAGLWARAINQVVPFFNVGLQAPAQVVRFLSTKAPGEVARPNQAQALSRVAGFVVAPTIALEAYNRQDPTYKDVPQYDKDRALIIMDPRGPGDVDPDTGRPTPRYAMIGLREWTPFAIATREAIGRALGDEDRDWKKVADAVMRNSSPVSLQEGVQAILPPWITVPIEMQTNYDTFRGREIIPESVQDRLPEEQYTGTTSETSKLIGRAIQKPPAMIEHAIRGVGTGVAGQALAASDMALRAVGAAPPAESRGRVRDIPVVGGLAGRFYREQGGEMTGRLREENAAEFADIMRENGLKGDEVQPVGWKIGDTRLTSAEQAEYQALFNAYFPLELAMSLRTPGDRAQAAREAASAARKRASDDLMRGIPGIEQTRREFDERARRAS